MPVNLTLLREIIGRGLVSGLGDPDATCIEGAIALASGEGLSDTPSCVAAADRAWAIAINDTDWPTPQARAEALLPIALAQIGTAGTDRRAWVDAVVLGTTRRVLPITLRVAGLEVHAAACEASTDLGAAAAAADAAAAAAAAAAAYRAEAAAHVAALAARVSADTDADFAYRAEAAAYAAGDGIGAGAARALRVAVEVALDAYRAEGRAP